MPLMYIPPYQEKKVEVKKFYISYVDINNHYAPVHMGAYGSYERARKLAHRMSTYMTDRAIFVYSKPFETRSLQDLCCIYRAGEERPTDRYKSLNKNLT